MKEIVKRIDLWGLNMVFVVGGNGGNAAANAIQEECERQGVICAIAAVPKSIDNDILLVRALWRWRGRGGGGCCGVECVWCSCGVLLVASADKG